MCSVLRNLSISPTFDNLKLDANTFRQILAENIVFVTKAFKNRLVIPDFDSFRKTITRLVIAGPAEAAGKWVHNLQFCL